MRLLPTLATSALLLFTACSQDTNKTSSNTMPQTQHTIDENPLKLGEAMVTAENVTNFHHERAPLAGVNEVSEQLIALGDAYCAGEMTCEDVYQRLGTASSELDGAFFTTKTKTGKRDSTVTRTFQIHEGPDGPGTQQCECEETITAAHTSYAGAAG